jgi:hypothetical protein
VRAITESAEFIYLFIEFYSISAAYCAALPGVTGCGRPDAIRTLIRASLERGQLSLKPVVFHQPSSTLGLQVF